MASELANLLMIEALNNKIRTIDDSIANADRLSKSEMQTSGARDYFADHVVALEELINVNGDDMIGSRAARIAAISRATEREAG